MEESTVPNGYIDGVAVHAGDEIRVSDYEIVVNGVRHTRGTRVEDAIRVLNDFGMVEEAGR